MERDASSRKVFELKVASQHNAELHILEAKIDMEILKTGTKATASVEAKENMQLTSDLEATRQHWDEMLHMIEWLKTAQKDLESISKLSYEEIAKLAAQNEGKAI
jgi:gamma-glutamylcysteine synthetase